jgi:hypothetical protein
MLSVLSFSKGKKQFLNNLLNRLYKLFISKKPLVLFEACAPFHLEHFKNVILKLSNQDNFLIAVISPDTRSMGKLNNVCFYTTIDDFPLYKKADVFISTELRLMPFWFNCPSVFFGHGMGPKLNYQAGGGLLQKFDYILSPCRPTYDVQINSTSKEKVYPLGMPILDDLSFREEHIYSHFNLDKNKPLMIYAPSWCNNISKVSDIKLITSLLQDKSQFNIIISPHPSLFNPERCKGEVFFPSQDGSHNLNINTPDSDFTTLELVKASTLVISDISSILFEAMALNKIVFFDGNKALYEYCEALEIYDEVVKVCPIPIWGNIDDQTIEQTLKNDEHASDRAHFINHYLFNNGNASNVFIKQISEILKL